MHGQLTQRRNLLARFYVVHASYQALVGPKYDMFCQIWNFYASMRRSLLIMDDLRSGEGQD